MLLDTQIANYRRERRPHAGLTVALVARDQLKLSDSEELEGTARHNSVLWL